MPTYGYECEKCREQFEVFQRITDAALEVHEGCGGRVRRLLYPVGIVFKGAGFHVNDYGPNGRNGAAKKAETGAKSDVADKPAETKPAETKAAAAT